MVEQIKETKRGGIKRDEGLRKLRKMMYSMCVCVREKERETLLCDLGKIKKLQDVYYPRTCV